MSHETIYFWKKRFYLDILYPDFLLFLKLENIILTNYENDKSKELLG